MEAIQELSERKTKILHAIIKNYLETGEPVGSRTISKYTDLNLSSATIRNEMADLEELGYIMQPHTSAGRIPSDKGYRWYVDMLMSQKEQEITEIKGQMLEKADKMEELLKQVAKVLANNTNYATMISTPTYNGNKLKFIQLSQVDDHQLIVVIVMEGNIVKNQFGYFFRIFISGRLTHPADGIESSLADTCSVFQVYAGTFRFRRKFNHAGTRRTQVADADTLFASQFHDRFTLRRFVG